MPVTSDAELREILERDRVAVVGCSTSPGKDAHEIPKYLSKQGYEVIPVNPFADEIFGQKAYDSLAEVPGDIDIIDVFRPSDEVSDIVDAALERDDDAVIWLQLGIHDDEAVERAEAAGRQVVQDRCMKPTHQQLMG
ncbi:CoA-binding protein [Haloarcula argentinensis]|uniref:CoA-binding protein n=1 Tax=Haloarcula argentinensis TaxID=43776 RepID=A0A830FQF5_HALAR|nr:CoA-binding protein [Haloarcula argentinensis]GGM47151.1 CoA-binding protein [Haloarcula argentinensis]